MIHLATVAIYLTVYLTVCLTVYHPSIHYPPSPMCDSHPPELTQSAQAQHIEFLLCCTEKNVYVPAHCYMLLSSFKTIHARVHKVYRNYNGRKAVSRLERQSEGEGEKKQ